MRLRPPALLHPFGVLSLSRPPDLRLASCGYDLRPSNTRSASYHCPGLRICAWLCGRVLSQLAQRHGGSVREATFVHWADGGVVALHVGAQRVDRALRAGAVRERIEAVA